MTPSTGRPALLVVAIALTASFVIGMAPTLVSIHHDWANKYGDFAHGYLLLFMAALLAWKARTSAHCRMTGPWWPAIPALAVVVILSVLFSVLAIKTLLHLLVPLALLLVIAATCGLSAARAFLGPIVLLYFGLPIGWPINAHLQHLTATVANLFVSATGIPAYVEGNTFHLPGGVVEVASGCSGLNYLLVGLSLAWFQGQMYLQRVSSRVRLLLLALVLSLLSNWVRVSSLVWIGYVSNMQHYLIRVDHLYFGWALFLLVIWPLATYGARLERREQSGAAQPGSMTSPAFHGLSRSTVVASALAGVILLLPLALRGALSANAARQPPSAAESRERWVVDGRPVDYYSARMSGADPAAGFPETAEQLLGRRWQPAGPLVFAETAGRVFEQQEGFFGGQRQLMRSGLRVAGYPAVAGRSSKLAALRGLLRLRSDWEIWVELTPCELTCESAALRLDTARRR